MSKTTKALAIMGVVAGLGVAALPMSSYATDATTNMSVDAVISDFISIENTTGEESDRTVHIGNITNNTDVKAGQGTVNVKTNSAQGFALKIKPAAATNVNMVSGSNTIPAGTPTNGTSAWGFKLSTDSTYSFFASASDEKTLKADYALPSDKNGTDITIDFGVTADGAQPAGTYTTEVILTASTNPQA